MTSRPAPSSRNGTRLGILRDAAPVADSKEPLEERVANAEHHEPDAERPAALGDVGTVTVEGSHAAWPRPAAAGPISAHAYAQLDQ